MKFVGRTFLLKAKIGGTYVTIGAQLTTRFSIATGAIDASDKGTVWRQLIEGGVRSLDVSSQGHISDDSAVEYLRQRAIDGAVADFRLIYLDGPTLDYPLQVAAFEASGDYDGAQLWDVQLRSTDGAVIPTFDSSAITFDSTSYTWDQA